MTSDLAVGTQLTTEGERMLMAGDVLDLDPLFRPRGVVVVGASSDPTKLGGTMAASLAGGGDHGVALVNPHGGPGYFATIQEAVAGVDFPVDLAVVCVPAAVCAEVVSQCGAQGIRAVLVCAGGFAEVGGVGVTYQAELAVAAREAGVRLLGPNTSGFFVPPVGLRASFVPGVADVRPGPVAVVAASGGLNHALAFALERRGVGVSLAVGIGAGIDVNTADVLEYLTVDDATTAVAVHLETVADGPRTLRAVRRLAAVKPVIALVVGQHDIGDFAQSHTGALATSWSTTRSLLRQMGAVIVDDEDQLVTAASVLAAARLAPKGAGGAALVTAQAGPGLLIADALHDSGVGLPDLRPSTTAALSELLPPMTYQANPVDTGRPGSRFGDVVRAVAADDQIDLVGVYALTEPVINLPDAVAGVDLGETVAVIGVDGPASEVEAARSSAQDLGIPVVVGARSLATAMAALIEDAAVRPVAKRPAWPRPAPEVPRGSLSEAQCKSVLDSVGIETPARRVCRTVDDARAALAELGGPVAIKISDASIVHKSDIGGVYLGIGSEEDLVDACAALLEQGATEMLVEVMAPRGIDLVVGARRDPVFGAIVLLGIGGISTEVYGDFAVAAVPTSAETLRRLPQRLRAAELLRGFRGLPPVDVDQLADVVSAVGDVLLANPHLTDVEINPLRAHAGGLTALDAVVVAHSEPGPAHSKEEENAHE
ncbi:MULTISPECIES: acetate--CoA ligase family protein [unclassified Aeromicrobium]|uniref:acetate--CoA ligase family protein n=1 Tax=unclassified Aeromicrobium TaxID=2633570 RepID=UPI00396B2153